MREIRKFQKSTDLLIQKTPFMRIIREIMMGVQGVTPRVTRIQAPALLALQEATEAFLVNEFESKFSPFV